MLHSRLGNEHDLTTSYCLLWHNRSRSLLILLFCQLLLIEFKPSKSKDKCLGQVLVGAGFESKPIYSKNKLDKRSTYTMMNKIPPHSKVVKLLQLTELTLLASTFILIAGDINPHPGPAPTITETPKLYFKARGL